MNYRKFYEKTTGMDIPKNHHIHHIDFNKNNNNIDNLVCLKNKLHFNYHSSVFPLRNIMETLKLNNYTVDNYLSDNWLRAFCNPIAYNEKWAKNLLKNIKLINKEILKRNSLIGIDYDCIELSEDQLSILKHKISNGRVY